MERFLEKTSNYLHDNYSGELHELCIVLPNRRASLFLKKYLAKQLDKTIWSPQIYSIEDFIEDISEPNIIDPIALQFDFYEVYKNSGLDDIQSFDDFSKWSTSLLHDFDEIDQYLVDTADLFSNLGDVKEIESWSLSEEQLTEMQQHYISFWQSIGTLYKALNENLDKRNLCYKGKAYRLAAENIIIIVDKKPWKKIIFAGFNALTKSEETIIQTLLGADKADVLWDADSYYVNDKTQEAGAFLRKYRTIFGGKQFNWEEDNLSTRPININIVGVAKSIGQAKYAGQLLSQLNSKESLDTAVVLADEQLLLPVLQSLPEEVDDINITMGYPMINTPIYGLIEAVFKLHINSSISDTGKHSFYYKDVLAVTNHPYFSSYILEDNEKVVKAINKSTKAFIDVEYILAESRYLSTQGQNALNDIMTPWNDSPDNATKGILHMIEQLKKGFIQHNIGNKHLNLEYLFAFAKAFKRIKSLISEYGTIDSVKSLSNIFRQLVRRQTLPFYGEPLKGLQIMGMLETRTLDFENVILLSANEDVLPQGKSQSSVIPFDLRKFFNLPTFSDKDAIFAYHFYRLIQRAKKVFLVYNTESDFMGSGEPSRFIKQLIHELPKANPNVTITETLLNIPPKPYVTSEITVEKTPAIFKEIDKLLARGISASSLNTYINCPLDFYYKYVIGLKEPETVEETIEAKSMGTYVHDALDKLYKPYVGKVITEDDLLEIKKKANNTLELEFLDKYTKQELFFGKNYLVLKVATKFLRNFIELELKNVRDKKGSSVRIVSLEDKLEFLTTAKINGEEKTIKLKGKVDRIDETNGTTRIIDFKTGNVSPGDLKVAAVEDVFENSKKAKSLQLLFYALLYHHQHPDQVEFEGKIVALGKISQGFMGLNINKEGKITASVLEEFEAGMKTVIKEIYYDQLSFKHNEESTYCQFCGL
ncbi:MAG: PD-(D/E)XK nuclease family protein [Flavobacteriales bacterium]|nr:PD-(D/E)XK nuclease family protein [Flavobacteriales bacterium]